MFKRIQLQVFLALAIFCFLPFVGKAQITNTEDVVYFKNGTILRGKVIEFVPDGNIKVEIMGGSIFVYPSDEVEKIVNEPQKVPAYPQYYNNGRYPRVKPPFVYKTSGFTNLFEVGFLVGSSGGGAFISNSFSYIVNPRLQVGVGGAFERYGWQLRFLPVYADIRGDILKNTPITPFYFGQVGYGFPVRSSDEWGVSNLRGGIHAGLGMGVKFNTRNALKWTFSLAYKMQQAEYDQNNWWGWPQHVNSKMFRVVGRFGLAF